MQIVLQCVLLGAIVLLLYSYLFYPVLMLWIGRNLGNKAAAGANVDIAPDTASLPLVAVIVAAFNEEKHIAARIENLLQQDYPPERFHILVGSDGSTDRTVELARAFSDTRLTVLDFPVNRGKASVLNDCVAQTTADVLVFTDANTVFKRDTMLQLAMAFDDKTGAVCGDLILEGQGNGSNQDHQYWSIERRLKMAESSIGGLLGANGGVYAIRRECYRELRPDTICDDFVIAMNIAAARKGLRYVPAAVAYEESPADVIVEFHRRVRIGIGNYQALFWHPRYLLSGSWALSFTYVSHKVLRWLTPHLLLLVLACSILLATHPVYRAMAIVQCVAYATALLVFVSRNRIAWPGFILSALFFAVLNVAFLSSFKRFVAADYRGSWRRTERGG